MNLQQINSQKGEIEFRKKLVQQQIEGQSIFKDEYGKNGIESILNERIQKTVAQINSLRENGVSLSPYVEIGSERCQRALAMENEIGATGAAVDISYDMLKSCDYYAKVFNRNKKPLRICCDANHQPFVSGSIPFVFCYQTLHHFPDPAPIVKEIHRILAPGGCFFFDEEPYRRTLYFPLYNSKPIYSQNALQAGKLRKILDHFFAKPSCNETEHGIIENDEIRLATWKKALGIFGEQNIHLLSLKNRVESPLFDPPSRLKYALAYLLGGTIQGTCRKSGVMAGKSAAIVEVLVCPSCLQVEAESGLIPTDTAFLCQSCNRKFPVIDGIVFLFDDEKFQQLYPEFFRKSPATVA
jgi:SAM-dependent methyltransferase/uncharacterized protein YbaR (Trm112 family)